MYILYKHQSDYKGCKCLVMMYRAVDHASANSYLDNMQQRSLSRLVDVQTIVLA